MSGGFLRRCAATLQGVRVLLVVLSVVVGLAGTLPAFARLATGPKAHVCHCDSSAHGQCGCPICFPELRIDDELASLKGSCGDDDTGWRVFGDPAVLPAGLVFRAPIAGVAPAVAFVTLDVRSSDPPDPRPPRNDRS